MLFSTRTNQTTGMRNRFSLHDELVSANGSPYIIKVCKELEFHAFN